MIILDTLNFIRQQHPNEIIQFIPGFDGYAASTSGRVFSFIARRKIGFLEMKHSIDRDGYLLVQLKNNGKQHYSRVHRLVMLTFIGTPPSHVHHVRHLDGNPQNNSLSNLAWGTPKENELDKRRHGRIANGSRHGKAKLKENDVITIRHLLASGVKKVVIAKTFDVTPSTITMIKTRKNWAHL